MRLLAHSTELGNSVFDFAASLSGFQQPLQIQWFDTWHGVLDEALQEPLDFGGYPPELWRLLALNPGRTQKKTALITDRGTPVAVAVLRRHGFHWEPATQFLLPGAIFPARENYLLPAMAGLSVDLEIAWWRMRAPPPAHPWIRSCMATPTHRLRLTGDFEEYWRDSSKMKDVRLARNRCRELSFTVDAPLSAEWTIRHWAERWSGGAGALSEEVDDRVIAANCLAAHNLHHTLLLSDGDRPIAGSTLTVQGDDVVAGVIHRDPEYDRRNAGTRIIDLSFQWAAEAGYQIFDIGGGHDYKQGWAPYEGERWQLRICPPVLFGIEQVLKGMKTLGHTVTEKVRR